MAKGMVRKMAGLICLALAVLLAGCVSSRYYEGAIQRLREENIDLRGEMNDLKKDLARQTAIYDALREILESRRETPRPVTAPSGVISRLERTGLEIVYRGGNPTVVVMGIFASGQAVLTSEGKERIKEIGYTIKQELPAAHLRVDGYTDNQPIKKTTAFKSNKELSAARAKNVAEMLATGCGFAGRVTSQGLGEKNPIADNNTREGREQNRRVEIIILATPKK